MNAVHGGASVGSCRNWGDPCDLESESSTALWRARDRHDPGNEEFCGSTAILIVPGRRPNSKQRCHSFLLPAEGERIESSGLCNVQAQALIEPGRVLAVPHAGEVPVHAGDLRQTPVLELGVVPSRLGGGRREARSGLGSQRSLLLLPRAATGRQRQLDLALFFGVVLAVVLGIFLRRPFQVQRRPPPFPGSGEEVRLVLGVPSLEVSVPAIGDLLVPLQRAAHLHVPHQNPLDSVEPVELVNLAGQGNSGRRSSGGKLTGRGRRRRLLYLFPECLLVIQHGQFHVLLVVLLREHLHRPSSSCRSCYRCLHSRRKGSSPERDLRSSLLSAHLLKVRKIQSG